MTKYLKKSAILAFMVVLVINTLMAQRAHTNWGKLEKYLVIQPSLNISAWETRSFVTNMTPVGDGTYQVKMDLTPGQYYNFVFMARTSTNAPGGLPENYTYYDQPPSTGWIPTSKDPDTIQYTNQAWYGSVTDAGDARRILLVPDLSAGESLYVFNNFNSKPSVPETVQALAGDGQVTLNWSKSKGNWSWDDINVMAGGYYYIYYNSTGPTNDYTLLASLYGNTTSFTHRNLSNGTIYYYVIVTADAYSQSVGEPFEKKTSDLPPPSGKAANQAWATPRGTMPVYFKVEHLDWNVVVKKNYLVWLTPADKDGRFFFSKTPGRIIKIKAGDDG